VVTHIGRLLIDRGREVRPWRYDKLESESILMDKPVPTARSS
jgi:hypothetical protein